MGNLLANFLCCYRKISKDHAIGRCRNWAGRAAFVPIWRAFWRQMLQTLSAAGRLVFCAGFCKAAWAQPGIGVKFSRDRSGQGISSGRRKK
jgi:hypothetical protein